MMKQLDWNDSKMILSAVNFVAGIVLAFSPWFLSYVATTSAAWDAWVAGAVLIAIALAAIYVHHPSEEWVSMIVGLWSVVSPWVLGFAALSAAVAVHVLAGITVAAISAIILWFGNNRPMSIS
jgi:hypothetical protein